MNEKQYSITVTTGLINRLDDAEIEAVLGHELTHIRNGDVRMLVIAVIIAGAISFFAELVFRLMFQGWHAARRGSSSSSDRKGGAGIAILIAIALIAVAWVLSIVIRFALSRKREFLADAGSVELTKNPDAMISALRKIEGRGELAGATSAVMEMCIDNPREGFSNVFDTHPSIDARVAALVKFAGGHDPGPLALPEPAEAPTGSDQDNMDQLARTGPWGSSQPATEGTGAAQRHSCRRGRRSGWAAPPPRTTIPVTLPAPGDRTGNSAVTLQNSRDAAAGGHATFRAGKVVGFAAGAAKGAWLHPSYEASMPLERDQRAHRHVELAQLVGAAEVGQIDDEAGGEHLGAELAQKLHRALRGAAGRDQVVDQDDAVALLHRVLVHLHLVEAVFQRIGDRHPLVRQLALLADRHEAGRDLMRHRAAEDEAARLDAGDLVDLHARPRAAPVRRPRGGTRAHCRAAW